MPDTTPHKLFIVGDSTASNENADQRGWGDVFGTYLDPERVELHNRALGGRSTRSFRREGHWQRVLDDASPGDWVLIQFGHNDAKGMYDDRARGTIPGIGDETQATTDPDGKPEIIRSFGACLRNFIEDAQAANMRPVLLTSVPLCPHPDEPPAIDPPPSVYAQWTRDVAAQTDTPLIDAHAGIQAVYDSIPTEQVKARYFSTLDTVHTNQDGAALNASIIANLLADCSQLELSAWVRNDEVSPHA